MWRFVSPALMFVVIISSVYFLLRHKPTCTAWDAATASGVRKEYPDWALAAAALLAVSSLVPVLSCLLHHQEIDLWKPGSADRMRVQGGNQQEVLQNRDLSLDETHVRTGLS